MFSPFDGGGRGEKEAPHEDTAGHGFGGRGGGGDSLRGRGQFTYQPCRGGEFPIGRKRNMNIVGGSLLSLSLYTKFTEFTLDSRVF